MFGDHGLCGLPEEGAHGKSPKCLGGNLGDFGEFCKGLEQCKNISQTAATFNLSRNTLYLWIRLKKQTGSLKHQVTGLNAVKLDRQKLAQYVGQPPDAYLHEIAKHFDCTAAAVCYALKQMGMTRKKRPPLTKNKIRPK